jgi:hypothetical protein
MTKEAFDGAYDCPRGFLQPTRSRSIANERRSTAYRIGRRVDVGVWRVR